MAALLVSNDTSRAVGVSSPKVCPTACCLAPRLLVQHGVGSSYSHTLHIHWDWNSGDGILHPANAVPWVIVHWAVASHYVLDAGSGGALHEASLDWRLHSSGIIYIHACSGQGAILPNGGNCWVNCIYLRRHCYILVWWWWGSTTAHPIRSVCSGHDGDGFSLPGSLHCLQHHTKGRIAIHQSAVSMDLTSPFIYIASLWVKKCYGSPPLGDCIISLPIPAAVH